MKYLGLVLILWMSSCATTHHQNHVKFKEHPLAIMQGPTSQDRTFIVVASKVKSPELSFFYSRNEDDKDLKPLQSFFKKTSPDGKSRVEHFEVRDLKPLELYRFVVKEGERLVDERTFKSLDPQKTNVRIGVASCMDDNIESDEMWESYLNKFLDVNFLIGDNVYADVLKEKRRVADYDQLWSRYLETWNKLYFYHSSYLSPTYAVWDDHDYGKNDGGKDYQHKEKSLEVFDTFYPRSQIKDVYQKNLGAGSVLTAFGQKFIFIDNRMYRDEALRGSHWGEEQKKQILSEIKDSKQNLVWLLQGDQFFGAYHRFESFEGRHPQDFKKTLAQLKKTKKKILFVSGDRHLSEIMKIEPEVLGYPTYELTSSGIHAVVFAGAFKREPNPRQEIGVSGVYNFSVIDISTDDQDKQKYKVTSYGAKDWTHYTKELSL